MKTQIPSPPWKTMTSNQLMKLLRFVRFQVACGSIPRISIISKKVKTDGNLLIQPSITIVLSSPKNIGTCYLLRLSCWLLPVPSWLFHLTTSQVQTFLILVFSKNTDLTDRRLVSKEEAEEMMKIGKFNCYVETSSLIDKGTVELVEYTVSVCWATVSSYSFVICQQSKPLLPR